jgi:indolepyruvate ferredoxin oxidoreductase
MIARAIGRRLIAAEQEGRTLPSDIRARIQTRLAILEAKERKPILLRVESVESVEAVESVRSTEPVQAVELQRTPTFCSGCPHNTSTHVPEGSRALAGIGCHFMAQWDPARRTDTFSQMGGEGAAWIGQAPFCETPHVFANMGDGTYFHSGVLAIRAAVAARATMTYKLLYNDAVAMTGGQPLDGSLTVPQVVAQLRAEGVREVVIVTDEPEKYRRGAGASGSTRSAHAAGPDGDTMMAHALDDVRVEHRDHLDAVQRRLREVAGVTVIVYDQTCASEKRRRRKRKGPDGQPGFPDPARRVVINESVCEGCGDCTVQSSCVSVEPFETPLGRKRKINQSSCNKDFSCLKGFCPSFVTVEGGKWRGRSQAVVQNRNQVASPSLEWPELPDPTVASVDSSPSSGISARPYSILVTGVGGTGVVTIGQLLGMAAHLDGRGVAVLDMAGLAQKGGAVTSHIQIAQTQDQLFATRVAIGEAQLVIGGDLVVTAGADSLARMRPGVTRVILNADVAPTVEALRNPDWRFPEAQLRADLLATVGSDSVDWVAAQRLAVALCGDTLFANPFMLGWACQRGWLPVTRAALERAIELNGAAVPANLAAFLWGRRAAHDFAAVSTEAFGASQVELSTSTVAPLDAIVELRARHLTDYQNQTLAQRYKDLVDRVRQAELGVLGARARVVEGLDGGIGDGAGMRLSEAVAQQYFRLLSYKDEYEIARLHSDPRFLDRLRQQFEGDWSLRFHLAPPGLARVDPLTGRPRKIAFGPWMLPVFRGLARLKFLRGTVFDPFGMTEERRQERALIVEYEVLIEELLRGLSPQTHALAVKLARIPEHIRGFGLVKEANLQRVRGDWRDLLTQWREGNRLQSAP